MNTKPISGSRRAHVDDTTLSAHWLFGGKRTGTVLEPAGETPAIRSATVPGCGLGRRLAASSGTGVAQAGYARLRLRLPLLPGIALALLFFVEMVRADSLAEAIISARALVRLELTNKAPGLAVAVAQEGRMLWSEGFGFADLARHEPVTAQTRFRIGSVAKPLTAAGLMLLVEQGRMNLADDVRKYVPDFPDKGGTITIAQLAGHLSGIRHYHGVEMFSSRHYDSLHDGLKIFENDPLLAKPGEKYSYSSYGYNLLGVAMESAARTNFLEYMREAVFQPLQMTNTVPDDALHETAPSTSFYVLKPGQTNFMVAPAVDNSYKWPSGGFLSTPEDLVRFGSAMLHPGFLQRASLGTMFTVQKTTGGKSTGYGIGWMVLRLRPTGRLWAHDGGSVGGSAFLLVYPDTGLVLAIAANHSLDKSGPALRTLAEKFTAALQASH